MKTWYYTYGNEKIVVTNNVSRCELIINNSIVDTKEGLMCKAELNGTLSDGKPVRADIGGVITVTCSMYIDGELQNAEEKAD